MYLLQIFFLSSQSSSFSQVKWLAKHSKSGSDYYAFEHTNLQIFFTNINYKHTMIFTLLIPILHILSEKNKFEFPKFHASVTMKTNERLKLNIILKTDLNAKNHTSLISYGLGCTDR